MTEKEISENVATILGTRQSAIEESERRLLNVLAKIDAELRVVRSKCKHRKKTQHSVYGMPTGWSCDVCGQEGSGVP